ncbi:MAG TPA: HDOD domain-containing protein [Spirochaetota bacterium]|nr:HDOD domain-containing protein [Spirochaetota bacterium]HQO02189.1 HDOD domain-containing protein [Spirochaetota bacterium]HQP48256.1 HDOD domain-containing protein [Spirochaetota bacterium]
MKQIVEKVKNSIDRMPSLSPVVHKISEIANDVRASAQDLTDIIQLDPVLTAKVIRMVNSAYFGLPQEVKSLKQAVVLLGINTIKNVAISSAFLGKSYLKGSDVLDGEDFWKHSLGVAVASKMVAKRLGIEDKFLEEYFIAGLIHDIGKILMNNFFPDEMKKILEISSRKNIQITEIEKSVLGLSHEEIGIAIGKKWKFETGLLYAVGRHHQPVLQGSAALFSMVVGVADTFVKILKVGFSGNYRITPIDAEVWKVLELEEEAVFVALSDINNEIDKARLFLK